MGFDGTKIALCVLRDMTSVFSVEVVNFVKVLRGTKVPTCISLRAMIQREF